MIAYTEKQAYSLFFKTLMYLRSQLPKEDKIERVPTGPTKHIIN